MFTVCFLSSKGLRWFSICGKLFVGLLGLATRTQDEERERRIQYLHWQLLESEPVFPSQQATDVAASYQPPSFTWWDWEHDRERGSKSRGYYNSVCEMRGIFRPFPRGTGAGCPVFLKPPWKNHSQDCCIIQLPHWAFAVDKSLWTELHPTGSRKSVWKGGELQGGSVNSPSTAKTGTPVGEVGSA